MNKFKQKLTTIFLALTLFLAPLFTILSATPASAIPFFDDTNTSDSSTSTDSSNPDNQPDSNQPNTEDNRETTDGENEEEDEEEEKSICAEQSGQLFWIVCPATTFLGSLIDDITGILHEFFEIDTISTDDGSPVYLVWQYMRNLTNIVFIIFILIVIYSQLTGLGINNYGVKRVLPRIIIAVILVNLSFIVCSLFIDISNILGNSIIDFCQSIQAELFSNVNPADYSWSSLVATFIVTGAGLALFAGFTGGLAQYFFMLLPVLIAGAIAVIIGLITIAARQALVALLVMIAPLAFVAYLLPNTEKWFNKWRELLGRMLIFYPMFSFLVGASQLLGSALIIAATTPFGTIIGYAVQVVPIFFAFSLMKMSGTILGSLNGALARIGSPINKTATGWASSHAEQRRQNAILHSKNPGAYYRRHLDFKKARRELDTKHAAEARQNKATDRALTDISGSLGYDKVTGRPKFRLRANRYTENAKLSSYYDTRASTAKDVLNNTISEYGDHFGGKFDEDGIKANKLNEKHAQAYLHAMSQKFLAANIAQGDQNYLLGKYLEASTNRYNNPEAYNRLIRGSAGSLGHLGESSIMGQVISENARIEQRRRSEARIIANKFGINKPHFRGMVFDCEHIDDDGFETDENGKAIEDANYNLKPGKQHRSWQQFIAVHKDTRREITAEQYNRLSDAEKAKYHRVNYMDITDDKGKVVQQVFADDAGYMKELLTDDITIGDPITQRYAFSIGRGLTNEEKDVLREKYHVNIPEDYDEEWAKRIDDNGIMRRYHSTISTATLSSRYKEHNSAFTAMLAAQANNGFIRTYGQYLISNLDSVAKSTKPGAFLQNDEYAIRTWERIISSALGKSDEKFEDIIPDMDIETFMNVNGLPLHGLRWEQLRNKDGSLKFNEDGNAKIGWNKIDRTDASITLEDRKNFLKHGLIPIVARKFVGMMDRNLSSGVLEGQKPGTYDALISLLSTLETVGVENLNPTIDPDFKLNPDNDIFDTHDPRELRDRIRNTKNALVRKKQGIEDWDEPVSIGSQSSGGQNSNSSSRRSNSGPQNSGSNSQTSSSQGSNSDSNRKTSNQSSAANTADLFNNALKRNLTHNAHQASMNDVRNILDNIFDICDGNTDLDSVCDLLSDYLGSCSVLAAQYNNIQEIIDHYRPGTGVKSHKDIGDRITHRDSYEADLVQQLYHEIIEFLQTIFVD